MTEAEDHVPFRCASLISNCPLTQRSLQKGTPWAKHPLACCQIRRTCTNKPHLNLGPPIKVPRSNPGAPHVTEVDFTLVNCPMGPLYWHTKAKRHTIDSICHQTLQSTLSMSIRCQHHRQAPRYAWVSKEMVRFVIAPPKTWPIVIILVSILSLVSII